MKVPSLSALEWVVFILIIAGGLNWGLVGFFKFNLVAAIFGEMSLLARVVYGLVGLATVYVALLIFQIGKKRAFKSASLSKL